MLKKTKLVMIASNTQSVLSKDVFNRIYLGNYPNVRSKLNQHLYFLSDDKIKEGDWFYHGNTGISKCTKVSGKMNIASNRGLHQSSACSKIIATTDKSLRTLIEYDSSEENSERYYDIPQPSESFLEEFAESYNKGHFITDVMVEYEDNGHEVDMEGRGGEDVGWLSKIELKINPKDNTITIKKVKDTWTRIEVELLCRAAFVHKDVIDGLPYDYTDKNVNKWIEQNL